MVDYPTWTSAVHSAYKDAGGDYQTQGVVEAITRAAARWWNENKEEIVRLAFDAAKKLAEELIREYIRQRGAFP